MSDADRVGLAYVKEVTYGVFPTGTALQNIRYTGETLKQDTGTVVSKEIRDDRQTTGISRVKVGAAGDINIELSYGTFDDMMEAGLQSPDWTSAIVIASNDTDVSASSVDNSFNTSTAWDNIPAVNSWIKFDGWANSVNNSIVKVVSATAQKIVVSGATLVTEAAGPSISGEVGSLITNGTELRTMSFEKDYSDITGDGRFVQYTGMAVDSFNLNMALESIITGTFTFMGSKEQDSAATGGTGTNTPAPTNSVMNVVDNIKAIIEDDNSVEATELSISYSNALRQRGILGLLGAQSIGSGKISLTGAFKAYYTDKTLISKYLNFETSNVSFALTDDSGNSYLITIPSVKFETGTRSVGGESQDVLSDMTFTAFMDADELKTIKVYRFPAA